MDISGSFLMMSIGLSGFMNKYLLTRPRIACQYVLYMWKVGVKSYYSLAYVMIYHLATWKVHSTPHNALTTHDPGYHSNHTYLGSNIPHKK